MYFYNNFNFILYNIYQILFSIQSLTYNMIYNIEFIYRKIEPVKINRVKFVVGNPHYFYVNIEYLIFTRSELLSLR